MKSTVETLSPTRVKLAIELPFDELKPSLDAAYKRIGAQIRIPGFRPGRAPARIIDQRVGRGAVLQEAVNEVLPNAFGDAVRENNVRALGQPDIEITRLDDGESLAFTAEVDVRPDITVPDFAGIAVEVDPVEVGDADVEEQLEALRTQFGTLKGVDRPVRTGDFVSLDLVAEVGGVEVEGGSAKGLSYEVGSDELIPGLDDALVGVTAGGRAEFSTTLQQGDQAGDEATVTATVNSVKERELPEADDAFAQLASEFDTVEELTSDLRTRLENVRRLEQGAQARDAVLEHLVQLVEVPVPQSVLDAEVGAREHDVVHSLGHDDTLLEQFLAAQGKSRDEFTAELRAQAEKTVKAQLVLDAIADTEQVGVENAELTEYLIRQARRYNMAPKDFADEIVKAGNLPALMADVRRNKALALVLQAATVTDTSGAAVDLSALGPIQLAVEEPDAELTHDHEHDEG